MRSSLVAALALSALASACDTLTTTPDDGGLTCGTTTCSATQVCGFRDCTDKERCVVSASCPANSTPSTCNGQPGCLLATCGPVVQGCRDVPAACNGDVQCACETLCGDAGACSSIDGRNIDCAVQ